MKNRATTGLLDYSNLKGDFQHYSLYYSLPPVNYQLRNFVVRKRRMTPRIPQLYRKSVTTIVMVKWPQVFNMTCPYIST